MLELIKNLGLDENEARIYLALLELGPSLVTEISKKAGINRTTSYDVLERLCINGLATRSSGQGARKKYSVLSPHHLITFLDNNQKKLSRRKDKAKKILPRLEMLYKLTDKPTVKFFEGLEGIKSIHLESLQSKEEILTCMDIDEWDVPDLITWVKEYNKERARKKVYERILFLPTPVTKKYMAHYPATLKYTQYRWLPKDYNFPIFGGEINIFENKVMIAILKRPHRMGILITSEVLANILKAMFKMAWEAAGTHSPTYPLKKKK